jgi:hypothetical protein
MQRTQLGLVKVDAGDVVVFSLDQVMKMAHKMGYNPIDGVDKFIARYQGVECGFGADGGYGVDRVTIVAENGEEYDGVLIGGPEGNVTLK